MATPNVVTKGKVAKALRAYGRRMDEWTKPINFTTKLTIEKANTFLVSIMFDQNQVAEPAWEKAEWFCMNIEKPFWKNIDNMEPRRLRGLLRYGYGGYVFHRYYKKYTVNLKKAAKYILEEYNGDPRKIWNSTRNVDLVRERLGKIPLIGPVISNFGVLWLARNYGLLGGKKTLRHLDVKPDLQLTRVFKRSGLVNRNDAFEDIIYISRKLAPDFPASIDPPAWEIGRLWCSLRNPKCNEEDPCPISNVCPKIGVRTV